MLGCGVRPKFSVLEIVMSLTVIVGVTVTFCVCVTELPESSVAVQVTTVVPTGKVAGASLVIVTSVSTTSVAVAVPITTLVNWPVASAVTSAGAVIDGADVSCTSTLNEPVVELPLASVDVQVTVVVPRLNGSPDALEQRTSGLIPVLSLALTE